MKQQLTVLTAVSALAIGLALYPDPPQAAVAPAQPGTYSSEASVMSVQGALPKGYNTSVSVRDPFALPAEYRPQPVVPAAGAGRDNAPPKPKEVLPMVQGIVGAGPTKVAIMSVGADSRSYRLNERIGSYVITAIHANSVTLQGPEGNVVVPLGR